MRFLYTALFYLLMPLVLLRLWYRARKAPAYGQRIGERLGYVAVSAQQPLWIHAVSVGETVAVAPLIEKLLAEQPDLPLLVTTTTPTGSAQVCALFGDRVSHCYCPWDLPHLLNRFLKRVQPRGLVIVETELWPNTIAACAKYRVPVILANARMSARSARGYQKVRALTEPMLRQLSLIAAQDDEGGKRFVELGLPAERLVVTGSIKFDHQPPANADAQGLELRQRWGVERPVLVAGSTRELNGETEDAILLDVFGKLRQQFPELLLVLIPRHPERFDDVARMALDTGFNVARRSLDDLSESTDILIGDSMGEMMRYYAAADLCFVGGSLVETGGHNPLEPAMLGKPVLMGPHLFNFSDISRQLRSAGGLTIADDSNDLQQQLAKLLANPEQACQQGAQACAFIERNRGALNRLYQLVMDRVAAG